ALAGLAEIRRQVLEARQTGTAPVEDLGPLLEDLAAAEEAVQSTEAERERLRRTSRERNQVTLLGQAVIGRLPTSPEDDGGRVVTGGASPGWAPGRTPPNERTALSTGPERVAFGVIILIR